MLGRLVVAMEIVKPYKAECEAKPGTTSITPGSTCEICASSSPRPAIWALVQKNIKPGDRDLHLVRRAFTMCHTQNSGVGGRIW